MEADKRLYSRVREVYKYHKYHKLLKIGHLLKQIAHLLKKALLKKALDGLWLLRQPLRSGAQFLPQRVQVTAAEVALLGCPSRLPLSPCLR